MKGNKSIILHVSNICHEVVENYLQVDGYDLMIHNVNPRTTSKKKKETTTKSRKEIKDSTKCTQLTQQRHIKRKMRIDGTNEKPIAIQHIEN